MTDPETGEAIRLEPLVFTVRDFARALEQIGYPDLDLSHLYAATD